jgi:hypothetical protein
MLNSIRERWSQDSIKEEEKIDTAVVMYKSPMTKTLKSTKIQDTRLQKQATSTVILRLLRRFGAQSKGPQALALLTGAGCAAGHPICSAPTPAAGRLAWLLLPTWAEVAAPEQLATTWRAVRGALEHHPLQLGKRRVCSCCALALSPQHCKRLPPREQSLWTHLVASCMMPVHASQACIGTAAALPLSLVDNR